MFNIKQILTLGYQYCKGLKIQNVSRIDALFCK